MKRTMIAKLLGGLLGVQAGLAFSAAVDLKQVFGVALESSPRLNIARHQLNVGIAQQDQAFGQLLPQISASSSLSKNRRWTENELLNRIDFEEYDGERYNMQLRQVLFNWQAFTSKKRSDIVVDQREAEYFDELALLMVDVSEKYLDTLEAQDALETVRSERQAIERNLRQVEQMYERKLSKVTDLYEVQARAAAVEVDEIDAENAVALAKEQLWEVAGMEIDQLFALSDGVDVPVLEGGMSSWVSKSLAGNTQIKARALAWEAAKTRISESRGAYYPTVNLVGTATQSDIGPDNNDTNKYESTYLGVDINIPIYSGGANSASVREAISQADISREELEQIRREVTRRARAAYMNLHSSHKRTIASRKAVESTSKASAAMRKGYEYGTVTIVDVLNALRDEYTAVRDLQAARYAHIKAMLYLKREAGTLSAKDLHTINTWLISPEQAAVNDSAAKHSAPVLRSASNG